jgi:hypothetical protein
MTAELKAKAWKDFTELGLPDSDWKAFWLGYVAAVKRFGGN